MFCKVNVMSTPQALVWTQTLTEYSNLLRSWTIDIYPGIRVVVWRRLSPVRACGLDSRCSKLHREQLMDILNARATRLERAPPLPGWPPDGACLGLVLGACRPRMSRIDFFVSLYRYLGMGFRVEILCVDRLAGCHPETRQRSHRWSDHCTFCDNTRTLQGMGSSPVSQENVVIPIKKLVCSISGVNIARLGNWCYLNTLNSRSLSGKQNLRRPQTALRGL